MGPAAGLDDAITGEQLFEAGIAVGMDKAAELLQVGPRMCAFAVRRVEEQRSRRALTGEGPPVADVNP